MREQDADVAERAEVQKVAIARNDDRCVGANGAGKHMIVVRIARGHSWSRFFRQISSSVKWIRLPSD